MKEEEREELERLFKKLREEPVPPLSPDFTRRTMERIQTPSFWERFAERFWNLRALSTATAVAASLVLAILLLPRFFPSTSFPGLSLREAPGPQTEKVFYVKFAVKSPRAKVVSVAGDFNQWGETPLALIDSKEGLFTVELPMARGTYAYAFVVDGKKWMADPTADRVIDDGFGNKNSLINL